MTNHPVKHRLSIGTFFAYVILYAILFIVVLLVLYPLSFTLTSAFSESSSLSGLSIYPFTHYVTVDSWEAVPSETGFTLSGGVDTGKTLYVKFTEKNLDGASLTVEGRGTYPLMMEDENGARRPVVAGELKTLNFYALTLKDDQLIVGKGYKKPALPTELRFGGFTLKQFRRLFDDTEYSHWYMNTLKIATINMLLSVCVTTVSAYIFSRFRFKGKKGMLMTMLVLQMFPSFAGMIAIYVLVWRMGLLDNHFALVLVYAAGSIPYNTWLIKGYLDTISKSLDEAARVDGAGYFRTFRSIILPIARPMVVFLAVTSFTGPWMDFLLPRLLIKSDTKKTLVLGLFDMIKGRENNNFTMFAAGAVLVAVPFVILFAINQQYMTQVLASGGVKE